MREGEGEKEEREKRKVCGGLGFGGFIGVRVGFCVFVLYCILCGKRSCKNPLVICLLLSIILLERLQLNNILC